MRLHRCQQEKHKMIKLPSGKYERKSLRIRGGELKLKDDVYVLRCWPSKDPYSGEDLYLFDVLIKKAEAEPCKTN